MVSFPESIEIEFADGSTESFDVPESEFAVQLGDSLKKPIVTTEVLYEKTPTNDKLVDQCGRTERRNAADNGWNIDVSGICINRESDESFRPQDFFTVVDNNTAFVVTNFFQGDIVVDNAQLTRSEDINNFHLGSDTYRAYQFQLQLGERGEDN